MSEPEQQIRKVGVTWQTILGEPTVHFFAIAALLFGLFSITQSRQENLLEISQREIDARVFMQEMTSGEELTAEQREFITSRYIEEQILVREALAMDLDNDARIHDMLAQKMRHVLSGNIIQPDTQELDSYYQANLDRYQTLPTVTVDELVFNSSGNLPEQVNALLDAGADPPALLELEPGNNSPLPNVNHIDLANIFELEFADRVFASVPGQWIGPFISNRGQHWLRVNQKADASLPSLDLIADRVRMDWIGEEEDRRLQEEIDKLWDRYAIRITDDVDD
jgi:hypothetical protein